MILDIIFNVSVPKSTQKVSNLINLAFSKTKMDLKNWTKKHFELDCFKMRKKGWKVVAFKNSKKWKVAFEQEIWNVSVWKFPKSLEMLLFEKPHVV
jgi:hypothetical protein